MALYKNCNNKEMVKTILLANKWGTKIMQLRPYSCGGDPMLVMSSRELQHHSYPLTDVMPRCSGQVKQ